MKRGVPFADPEHQLEELSRGVVDLHTRAELLQRLTDSRKTGKPLRIKAGFDPTRPDLHLGHTVVLRKLRQFQDFGHTVVFLIGDVTAMVGDPTGRNKLRPQLSRQEIDAASETYVAQCLRVLSKENLEVRKNGEWLEGMRAMDLVSLMAKSTVSRMLERNDFAQRFAAQKPIHQHEFLYPLLQGYDSVALECDLEIGGTDQLFNLMVGRDIMPSYGQRAQLVLTVPLLEGINASVDEAGLIVGEKMSKSADNYVGIDEPPDEQFRKLMLVHDQVIWRYFELLSAKSAAEIAALRAEVAAGGSPREVKKRFASEIVARFSGEAQALAAQKRWELKFQADAVPDDVPEIRLATQTDALWLPRALADAKLVGSSSQGRQLVEQGGVELDGARVTDSKLALAVGGSYLVRVGSKNRKFARLLVERTSG
jgi:tyrosyl-tRNA synthetase